MLHHSVLCQAAQKEHLSLVLLGWTTLHMPPSDILDFCLKSAH